MRHGRTVQRSILAALCCCSSCCGHDYQSLSPAVAASVEQSFQQVGDGCALIWHHHCQKLQQSLPFSHIPPGCSECVLIDVTTCLPGALGNHSASLVPYHLLQFEMLSIAFLQMGLLPGGLLPQQGLLCFCIGCRSVQYISGGASGKCKSSVPLHTILWPCCLADRPQC